MIIPDIRNYAKKAFYLRYPKSYFGYQKQQFCVTTTHDRVLSTHYDGRSVTSPDNQRVYLDNLAFNVG